MKIDFEYTTDYGVFRDALTLPDDHSYTDDELEAMKVSRRDKWIAVVKHGRSLLGWWYGDLELHN
jgi:hypothetical protein